MLEAEFWPKRALFVCNTTHTDTQTRTNTDTDPDPDPDPDTQTHRHTDTQAHRHTDTQTHRHLRLSPVNGLHHTELVRMREIKSVFFYKNILLI